LSLSLFVTRKDAIVTGFLSAAARRLTILPLTAFVIAGLLSAGASAQNIAEKAQVCTACHGEQGVPIDNNTPAIWGQKAGYLYLQLRDFKSGARKSEIMGPVAQTLPRDDMLALAEYFEAKPWPALGQPAAPADIATRAARTNNSIGCTGCHQGQYQGDGTQPRLAGQRREYLERTMLDFRDGKRGNNPGMSDLMKAASPDDLKAMAQYLAGLQLIPGQ
jgi:cytochrome c553